MKSNIRVFAERKITAEGKVLPRSECRLAHDLENHTLSPESGEFFVRQAEKLLGEEIPLLPLSLYRDFFQTMVRSRFEGKYHRRRMMLLYMTLAEAYERKGRFVEKIADALWAILEETTWLLPAHYYHSPVTPSPKIPEVYTEEQMPGIDLCSAQTCGVLALTRYLLTEELNAISPVLCKRLDHLVYLRGIRPFVTLQTLWSGELVRTNKVNNWVTNITSVTLLACAVCTEDTELRTRVLDRSMRYLDNFTACCEADGCCDEGPGYWSGAGANYFDCLELIEDMTGAQINVYDHPFVQKLGEYIANVHIDGKYYLNFADSRPQLEQDGKMILRWGEKIRSEELAAFGRMTASENSIDRYYPYDMAYRIYKSALMPEIREADKVPAKQAYWFEDAKIAVFRETPFTSDGLYLAAKGGSNAESHNHNDVGCFVVYADGKPVIVDPSHGSYDHGEPGTRYQRWYMKSSGHSIPTVDKKEQQEGKQYVSSDENFDADARTLSMELKNAFPADAGILSMRRTCALRDGAACITDTVRLDHEGEITFHYITVDEPKPQPDGSLSIAEGRTFRYAGEGLSLRVEKVENTWLPYEDLNIRASWGRDCLWRICLTAHAREATAAVTVR